MLRAFVARTATAPTLARVGGIRMVGAPRVRLFSAATGPRFTKEHEYVVAEGDGAHAKVGISDYAQSQLGDVVYVELPSEGDSFAAGDVFGTVESVKAASDVFLPISGVVVGVNEELESNPGLVNDSAMKDGWFVRISMSNAAELDALMDAKAYDAFCMEEDH